MNIELNWAILAGYWGDFVLFLLVHIKYGRLPLKLYSCIKLASIERINKMKKQMQGYLKKQHHRNKGLLKYCQHIFHGNKKQSECFDTNV